MTSATGSARTKTYTGYRVPAAGGGGDATVSVHEPGGDPRPLAARLDLRTHSPTGLEWGYAGSGPAQLALALADDVLADDDRALDVYQRLKFKLVGRLPADGWSLTEAQVRAAIADIERDRDRSR